MKFAKGQRIGQLEAYSLQCALAGMGLVLDCGAARIRVRSDVQALAGLLRTLYASFPVEDADGVFDATVWLRRVRGIRRLLRPQVELLVDGEIPFEPFPMDTPLPLLEWGINYTVATRLNHFLLLHAGVVERGGRAIVLPALPGSGKSTLTSALATTGLRLLSDEFGVVSLADSMLVPMLRPVALKNDSIDIIRQWAPSAVLGPRFPKTRKGTVAHLAPDEAAVEGRCVSASPAAVIFPRFERGTEFALTPVVRSHAFARLAVNSFNFEMLGPDGFDALARLIGQCECYELRYQSLERAVDELTGLIDRLSSNH
jgi:HprK-related kinase A